MCKHWLEIKIFNLTQNTNLIRNSMRISIYETFKN